VIKKKDINNA